MYVRRAPIECRTRPLPRRERERSLYSRQESVHSIVCFRKIRDETAKASPRTIYVIKSAERLEAPDECRLFHAIPRLSSPTGTPPPTPLRPLTVQRLLSRVCRPFFFSDRSSQPLATIFTDFHT